jgi:hypothetical protein
MTRDSEHTCHAEGCEVHVPPRIFMCRSHWVMVPMELRGRLLAEYDEVWASTEYLLLAMQCVEAVAQKEAAIGEQSMI